MIFLERFQFVILSYDSCTHVEGFLMQFEWFSYRLFIDFEKLQVNGKR